MNSDEDSSDFTLTDRDGSSSAGNGDRRVLVCRNGKRRAYCKLWLGAHRTLSQLKQSAAFELGLEDNAEISLVTYKGCELVQDDDLDLLPPNAILFVLLKGIRALARSHLDETFDYHNFLVPYHQIRPLGQVFIAREP